MTVQKGLFKQWGWVNGLISCQGWLAAALLSVFSVQVFGAVARHSHSGSDRLYGIFPCVIAAVILLNWFASRTVTRG